MGRHDLNSDVSIGWRGYLLSSADSPAIDMLVITYLIYYVRSSRALNGGFSIGRLKVRTLILSLPLVG